MSKLNFTIYDLVEKGYELGASDVMLKANAVPYMKQYSSMNPLPGDWAKLTGEDVMELLKPVMLEKQIRKFDETNEMDLAFVVEGKCRVRTNIYRQRTHPTSSTASATFTSSPSKTRWKSSTPTTRAT